MLLIYYKAVIVQLAMDIIIKSCTFKAFLEQSISYTQQILYTVTTSQDIIIFIYAVTTALYFLRPIFSNDQSFVFETMVPESFGMKIVLLMSQYYYLCIAQLIVYSYDMAYACMCIHIVLQTRLLKQKIVSIINEKDKSSEEGICDCIQYHQFLLS